MRRQVEEIIGHGEDPPQGHQWETAHPDLASLAEQVQHLSGEVERLRDLLREHGIEPKDNTA